MISSGSIEKYKGRTVVIKYGGAAMETPELKAGVMADVAALAKSGARVVIVHGGGKELTALLKKTGKESVFVDGLRVTDAETRDFAMMVFCGKINKELASLLSQNGVRCVGISGVDAGCVLVSQKDARLGYVGKVEEVDTYLIETLVNAGCVPVISSMGIGKDGGIYNVNADTVAGSVAASLKADVLIMMTDISGVCRDPKDSSTVIPAISLSEAEELKKSGVISGGMIPKTECCTDAIKSGVGRVYITDGRVEHSVLSSLCGGNACGTVFLPD